MVLLLAGRALLHKIDITTNNEEHKSSNENLVDVEKNGQIARAF